MDKEAVRGELLQWRRRLSAEEVEAKSQAIVEAILATSEYQQAKVIMAYLAWGQEVNLDCLLQQAMASGKIIGVPLIYGRGLMHCARLESWASLVSGEYGIRKVPAPASIIEPSTIDLLLVPGVGFTSQGGRLGMGQGFYDRYLPQCSEAVTMGIGYQGQLCETLPQDKLDYRVKQVVTETGRIVCS